MRFFHISDLHIGKRVCGFSMLEDQRYILEQIIGLVRERRPNGVLIAGDLYDKPLPSAEAVELADWFLTRLAGLQVPVWTISGNHDSAERIAYGGKMMEKSGVYMSRVFDGRLQRYTISCGRDGKMEVRTGQSEEAAGCEAGQSEEAAGCEAGRSEEAAGCEAGRSEEVAGCGAGRSEEAAGYEAERSEKEVVDLYLLPFVRPAQVRKYFPGKTIETTQQAVEAVLEASPLKTDRVNILMMHQFMAGATVCESEEISVGGSDQVSVAAVAAFDYVALGHLHGPQRVGRDTVRYCGSPLKYSFSEARHQKSLTIIETGRAEGQQSGRTAEGQECAGAEEELESGRTAEGQKAEERRVNVYTVPLIPRLDLREIRGPIEELLRPEVYRGANPLDYLHITLTDEDEILDAIGKLREVYPNIMRLDFATQASQKVEEEEILPEEKTPEELFEEFFFLQTGREMSEAQKEIVRSALDGGLAG